MSLSSATTLISPTSTKAATPSATVGGSSSHAHQPQRRASVHSSHVMKRKPSTHAAHTHHGNSNRRSSESEHGRRALAAGLAMHALDTTDALVKRKKEKRPLPSKNSRSDTHLPRLSRTTSMTSNTSHESHGRRPSRGGHKRSEESVSIVQDNGEEGEEVDEGEEGWESGDGGDHLEISPEKSKRGKSRANASQQTRKESSGMRRTVSDTSAEPTKTNDPIISEILDTKKKILTPSDAPHPPALTQKTTGFAGTTQQPDPSVPAQDPHPVVTPGPIRRNTSAKSLVGPISMEPTTSNDSAQPPPDPSVDMGRDEIRDKSRRPEASSRLRSTEGSGLPKSEAVQPTKEVSTSPSYPFPQMPSEADSHGESPQDDKQPESAKVKSQERQRHTSQPAPLPQSQPSASGSGSTRSRQTSQQYPQLRHRYSNSSLRSIQSLRAPPHPLNSPTGYRTQPTTATSRPGSLFGSPTKADARQRVSSMHHPPAPKPQVSYEMAKGQGWDEPILEEDIPRRSGNSNSQNRPQSSRKESVSSMRSIFAPLTAPTMSSPVRSSSGQGGRRKTALEAAAQASKMSSTNDPTAYHNSLGHANIPETVYLISRFLPNNSNNKKSINKRPKWEMNPSDLQHFQEDHEHGDVDENDGIKIGLTNGDYRESHESLVKTFKNLSINQQDQKRNRSGFNRNYSSTYNNLISPGMGIDGGGEGLLKNTNKDGYNLIVKKGFGGKTPFEMSLQRCLAQRPGGGNGIGF
ncbi:uncharacterized protein I206_104168 [Kwoniella pini CBS 10737]|uniref:Uncharacterized protein n=1 Tax=Kwoniella pini CBS 10737 TaxID=1296096 RepID=A0A1B9I2H1_9TREE|nr:uncharacterized protein I206_04257 [Kwoniella pini CBS 10737]OCF49733.1 hypothetical protein I206_04257 [Kwoniella pini CBS 10737]